MNFRNRLIGAVTLLTVLTLGAAFFAIWVVVNRDQERELDAALVHEAAEEAREASALGGDELAISDRPGPAANDLGPLTKYGAIYASDGRVLASTPTFRSPPPPYASLPNRDERPFDLVVAGEHLRAVHVTIPGHAGVHLLLAAPRAYLDSDEAFLARAMLFVLLAAVAWSVVVATALMGRLTRHHQAIAAVARRVADGDLGARVHATAADPDVAQLARDIDTMIERLESLIESQQRFVANAAHELRSPLTALYGELSHALRRSRDANEYRTAIEEALDSSRRLKTLAEDLLVLAAVGSIEDTQRESVSLRAVIDAAAETVRPEANARGVAIETHAGEELIRGRARDVERMLRNLVENAVRHAPRGTAVRIACERVDGEVRIAVEDDGPGVRPEDRERVFEPFFRGPMERASDAPGAGLGLAIAREIARRTGGDVSIEPSTASAGTRFVVRCEAV